MAFNVAADAYDRFMGRYSEPLAARFVDWLNPPDEATVLDVGCGPGALTGVLVDRYGRENVRAVDPSPTFLTAVRERFPGVDVREATAAQLPWGDDEFDLAAASLVLHFMPDPVAGIAELRRVTTPGGIVGATVWSIDDGRAPVALVRRVALGLDPDAEREDLPGTHAGDLETVFRSAGLADVEGGELEVSVRYDTFEEWWEPYLLGVGPLGDYLRTLDDAKRSAIRDRCRQETGAAPFEIRAVAFAARGRA